jgi:hypothetical protein
VGGERAMKREGRKNRAFVNGKKEEKGQMKNSWE